MLHAMPETQLRDTQARKPPETETTQLSEAKANLGATIQVEMPFLQSPKLELTCFFASWNWHRNKSAGLAFSLRSRAVLRASSTQDFATISCHCLSYEEATLSWQPGYVNA